jgi:hypothetical protein
MDRLQIITSMFEKVGVGLEIGPSYNPIIPKSSGARIESLDHLDQAGLILKYKDEPNVDITRIEPVDYVSDGGPITETIPYSNYYSYILASHVIEHMPNPLGFLRDCSSLLTQSGVVVLVVPDRRYCFDYFRPASTTGAILQAYRSNRRRHLPGTLFDHAAYVSRRGPKIAWSERDTEPVTFVHTLAEAASGFADYDVETPYADCHAWQFTPSSLRLILSDLAESAFLDLREHAFHDTVECEFFVALSRRGQGCPVDRLTLATMALMEGIPAQLQSHAPTESAEPAIAAAFAPEFATSKGPPTTVGRTLRNVRKRLKRLARSLRPPERPSPGDAGRQRPAPQ